MAGTFDIIHPGHINLIKQAKSLGDFLVVVIGRDQNVFNAKGRKPYYNERQRLENLNALLNFKSETLNPKQSQNSKFQTQNFYKIVLGDIEDPYKIIKDEKPDIIALGYDQQNYVEGLKKWIHDTRYKLHDLSRLKKMFVRAKISEKLWKTISQVFCWLIKKSRGHHTM